MRIGVLSVQLLACRPQGRQTRACSTLDMGLGAWWLSAMKPLGRRLGELYALPPAALLRAISGEPFSFPTLKNPDERSLA